MELIQAELAAVRQGLTDRSDHQAAMSETVEARLASLQAQIDALPEELAALVPEPAEAVTAASAAPSPEAPRPADTPSKLVVGEMERVWLEPPGASLVAKIDPSVASSTLSAQDVVVFERDGRKWVRFNLTLESGVVSVERPLRRNVRVAQPYDSGGGGRRPAVTLRVRLGDVREAVEVALVDLSEREYGIVLGRNFLTDLAVLDVSQKFLQPAFQAP
jgi:hypothetical protein